MRERDPSSSAYHCEGDRVFCTSPPFRPNGEIFLPRPVPRCTTGGNDRLAEPYKQRLEEPKRRERQAVGPANEAGAHWRLDAQDIKEARRARHRGGA
ncbi:hypothetical protein MRX96_003711 [Rhipicephalus microplus]